MNKLKCTLPDGRVGKIRIFCNMETQRARRIEAKKDSESEKRRWEKTCCWRKAFVCVLRVKWIFVILAFVLMRLYFTYFWTFLPTPFLTITDFTSIFHSRKCIYLLLKINHANVNPWLGCVDWSFPIGHSTVYAIAPTVACFGISEIFRKSLIIRSWTGRITYS